MDEESLWNHFEEILDEFDFKNILKVMELLDWCWHGEPCPPTIHQMKQVCRELFSSCVKYYLEAKQPESVSSSGFDVEIFQNGAIRLNFVVETAEYYAPDFEEK